MRAHRVYLILAAWVAITLSGPAQAGIVFEQLPNRTGGQASDTDYFSYSFGGPFWQLEADNVQLSTPEVIRLITWWGFYGGDFDEAPDAHNPPAVDETMRIRFYAPREIDGLPDSSNILFEESFLNPSRTATGRTLLLPGVPDEYQFEIDLGTPFYLEANTLYWLEIAQVGDQSSHFRWERGSGLLLGRVFSNPVVPDWQSVSGSFSFQLSTVPEPGTVLLLILMSSFYLWGRGGRRVLRA